MDTKRLTLDTTLTLIAAYLGLFVGLIDANAINLALPAIRDDLGGGISGAQWTIDAYNITFAAMLLTSGSLGDRFGQTHAIAHRPGDLHRRVAGLRGGPVAAAAAGRARRPGRRRGGDVAAGPRHHRRRISQPRRTRPGDGGVGDGRSDEHRDRPDHRRRADRHHRLALHLLAQRARRSGRTADDVPLPSRIPRPRRRELRRSAARRWRCSASVH